MLARILLVLAFSLVIVTAPAAAAGSAQVPEADSLTLFVLGVLGVMVGRRAARKPRRGDIADD